MTRWRDGQLALGQVILFGVLASPESLMDPELRRIDALLADDALVEAVWRALRHRRPQSARRGRPSTPAEVVLRLLVLKHLRGWSYERLEWEVRGNIVYRHFCRLAGGRVPDAKTLVRLGQVLGESVLREVLERVVGLAVAERVTRGRRLRIDTTVVEAPIRHPTDSGLCADAIRVVSRLVRRVVAAGVALPGPVRNVHRSVTRRLHEIGQAMRRRGEAGTAALRRPYRRLLAITRRVLRQAAQCTEAAAEQCPQLAPAQQRTVKRLAVSLHTILPRAHRIVAQTRARIVRGITTTADKVVSLFEPDAQVLRRGKPHRPTEFGALVKVQETEGGIVSDIAVVPGKADAPLLVPAVEQHRRTFGRAPALVASDRGFHSNDGERRVRELGVRHAVIPKPGFHSRERIQYEQQRWFRRERAWRAGGEARIARWKHSFGMARSSYHGPPGMARTIYWAAIANNLAAIATRSV
jgi:IS5 family transposase